jgi:hypothetical protein
MQTRDWLLKVFLGLALSTSLAGCGGGDDDNTPPPVPKVSFTTAAQNVAEDVGMVAVGVQVSPASANAITVHLAVAGTAASGADFTALPTTLTIPANTTSASFNVAVTNDTAQEPDETIVLTLSAPSSGALGTQTTQTITVAANDGTTGGGSVVSVASATSSAAEDAGTVNITVQVSPTSTTAITVPFTITGTANGGGVDYSFSPASPLTIPANAASANIVVTVVNDTATEGDETVVVTLGTPTGATLGTATTHTLTISANDSSSADARAITIDPSAASPADLSTPTSAAKFASAITTFGNAASSTSSGGSGTGKSGGPKAACASGGTQDSVATGTPPALTITTTYDNCQPNATTLLDGVFAVTNGTCTPAASNCFHSDVAFGTSSQDTFLTETLGPAGKERRNLLFGNGTTELTDTSTVDHVAGQFDLQGAHINTSRTDEPRIDFRIGNESSNFHVDIDIAADHSTDAEFAGPFRVSGACGSGQGNVTTPTPVHTNSAGQTTSGQIMVTNSSGGSATYTYNTDGSVTVAAGSTSHTFTAAELDQLCNIE